MMFLQRVIIILLAISTLSCTIGNKKNEKSLAGQKIFIPDTIVGSKIITEELAGSVYRKRAKGYFTILNNDTSDFVCYLTESKYDRSIDISIRTVKSMTYREQMIDLEKIISVASVDFNFDSLKSIGIGRFVTMGDLAVKVTKEYTEKYGDDELLKNYGKVSSFLISSSLVSDFNSLFEPFLIEVDTVYVEKVFFADKESLFVMSKLETDSTQIPDKILDCIIWVGLRKIKSSEKVK